MIKFLFLGRRAAGRTRAAALGHLRDIHGGMVVCPPVDAGEMPAYYAQNHVIDGAYPVGSGPHAIERDLVTQLEFESMAAMRDAVETPYYRNNLKPDEPRFVDDATVERLNVTPRIVIAGARTRYKLFVLASRAPAVEDAGWTAACAALSDAIAGWDGVASATDNEVMAPPTGSRFVDRVFEVWFADAGLAHRAAALATAAFDTTAIDRNASLVIVAEEFTRERLRALLGC